MLIFERAALIVLVPSVSLLASEVMPPEEGKLLWLDASKVSQPLGSQLSVWEDQSGNGNDSFNVHGTGKPILNQKSELGAPTLKFAGNSDYMRVSTLSDDFSDFTVTWALYPYSHINWNQHTGTSWGGFSFHTTANGSIYTGIDTSTRMTPANLPAGTMTLNELQFFTFTYTGGVGSLYKNGHLLHEKSGMTASQASFWSHFRTGFFNDADIGEVIVYSRSLTTKEVGELELYYERKYDYLIDTDSDGMFDGFELQIINFSDTDSYSDLASVNPADDFDADGALNLTEMYEGSNPADATSISDIPHGGLVSWLDSRDIFSELGQNVEAWADRSGMNNDAILANTAYSAQVNQIAGLDEQSVNFGGGPDHLAVYGLGGGAAFTVSWSMHPEILTNYNQALGTSWGGCVPHNCQWLSLCGHKCLH